MQRKRTLLGASGDGRVGLVGLDGFRGYPYGANRTGSGWPDSLNVWPTQDSTGIRTAPGYVRTLRQRLWDGTARSELSVYGFDANEAYENPSGVGLGVVDGRNGRVLSLGFTESGQAWSESTSKKFFGYMNRLGPWEFPEMVTAYGKTHIFAPYDTPKVYDGAVLRDCGIPSPKLKPSLTVTTGSADVFADDMSAAAGGGSNEFTVHANQSGNVTIATEGTIKSDGNNSLRVRFQPDSVAGYVFYRNLSSAEVMSTAATHFRIKVYIPFATFQQNSDAVYYYPFVIPKGWLSLVVATDDNFGGTVVECPMPIITSGDRWADVVIPWPNAGTNQTFSVKSFGIKLNNQFQPEWWGRLGGTTSYRRSDHSIYFDDFKSEVATAGSGDDDEYQVCFTWYDSVRKRESNPSPYSDAITIPAGASMTVDLSGYYTGITQGLQNFHPDRVSVRNSSYRWTHSGGTQAGGYYLELASGGDPRIPFAPAALLAPSTVADLTTMHYVTASTDGTMAANEWDYGDYNSLGYNTIYYRPTGSVSPGSLVDPDSITEHGVSYIRPGVDRVKVYLHKQSWGVGPDGRPRFYLLSPDDGEEIPIADLTNFKMEIVYGTSFDEDLIQQGGTPNYYNETFPACEHALLDGTRLLAFGQRDYSVGQVTFTSADPFVCSGSSGATFGRWMEGRRFRGENGEDAYVVIRAFSSTVMGSVDRLMIGRNYSLITNSYTTSWAGVQGTAIDYVILGYPNRVWWSSKTNSPTSGRGSYTEATSGFNFLDLEMPGDELIGGVNLEDNVALFGRRHVYILTQDHQAIDDDGGVAYLQPRLMHGWPGCIAGRTLVSMTGGGIAYLAQNNRIVIGGLGGFEEHPVSDAVGGWLSVNQEIDTELIKYAHGVWDNTHQMLILHFPEEA